MKNFLSLILALAVFAVAACSKKSDKETTVSPQSTPEAARLKSDSERLQQATANAAKEREKANQPTPSPTATP
jgi:Na+-transporting methylmalonyl-CoA/oxaloacetate decarboxylase gamma subunit